MNLIPQAESYFEGCHLQKPLPAKVQELLTPEGFNDFVQTIYQATTWPETQCYEYAENYFQYIFGYPRYDSYNSYKSSFWQIMRRKSESKKDRYLPMFPDYDEHSGAA